MAVTTYYVNANIGTLDAQNAWVNDANAFDGSTTTVASMGGTSSSSSGALVGRGTTAPTSGNAITQVRARIYAGGNTTGTRSWSSYVTLSTPTGGWDWTKVSQLESRAYNTFDPGFNTYVYTDITTASNAQNLGTVQAANLSSGGADSGNLARVDIEVTTSDSGTLSTDLFSTTFTSPAASFTRTHTTDAVKRKATTVSHTTSANKKRATTVSHTTSANKKKTFTLSHTTDAFKKLRFTIAHTTDAFRRLPTKVYSKEGKLTLPTNDTNLASIYTTTEEANVLTTDSVYTTLTGSGYVIHQYKDQSPNLAYTISLSWTGKSNTNAIDSPVNLQIYNRTTTAWETLATNDTATAGTNFTLSGTVTTGLSDYYDAQGWVSARVWRQI